MFVNIIQRTRLRPSTKTNGRKLRMELADREVKIINRADLGERLSCLGTLASFLKVSTGSLHLGQLALRNKPREDSHLEGVPWMANRKRTEPRRAKVSNSLITATLHQALC